MLYVILQQVKTEMSKPYLSFTLQRMLVGEIGKVTVKLFLFVIDYVRLTLSSLMFSKSLARL